MSQKSATRSKGHKAPAVTTTGIRSSDLPKLEKLASKLGMKKVEYLGRVLERDENKLPEELAAELLGAGK